MSDSLAPCSKESRSVTPPSRQRRAVRGDRLTSVVTTRSPRDMRSVARLAPNSPGYRMPMVLAEHFLVAPLPACTSAAPQRQPKRQELLIARRQRPPNEPYAGDRGKGQIEAQRFPHIDQTPANPA